MAWNVSTLGRNVTGLIFAGLFAGTAVLGGCGVSQEQYQQLQTENTELRQKVTNLENDNKAKDAQISQAQQNQAPVTLDGNYPESGRKPTTGGGAKRDVVLEIAGDVLFDSGQVSIKSTAKKELDKIASMLNGKYSGHDIRIEGHTDSDPIKKSKFKTNEALSEARADAVRDYLASKGVSRRRMDTVGKGASEPKGSKKESRRVDVVVLAN